MDDEIVYSWCFDFVECFDSTSSIVIIVLVENLESFLSLISQQFGVKFYGHNVHFILHIFIMADYKSETKSIGLLIFYCVLLVLARQEERGHQLIII